MYAQAYANGVSGKLVLTVGQRITRFVGKVSQWCDQVGLRVYLQREVPFPSPVGVARWAWDRSHWWHGIKVQPSGVSGCILHQ